MSALLAITLLAKRVFYFKRLRPTRVLYVIIDSLWYIKYPGLHWWLLALALALVLALALALALNCRFLRAHPRLRLTLIAVQAIVPVVR